MTDENRPIRPVQRDSTGTRTNDALRLGRALLPRLFLGGCLAVAGSTLVTGAAFAYDFADYVAERNLGPARLSDSMRFPEGGDAIDLFNGALSYTIPLGGTYPVGGFLSYQLRLVYTSSIWDLSAAGGTVTARPGWRFNAGLGWSLSFGELLAPASTENPSSFWVWVDPDGKRTRFYSAFEDGAAVSPGVFYSHDGSYRRLTVVGATALLESPDGLVTTVQQLSGVWRFTGLTDPFGNSMSVDYSLPDRWVISDSHGRLHVVYFKADPTGSYAQLVDRVELAAFGGTTATYQMFYATGTVFRPVQDDDPLTPDSQSLPLLDRVQPPIGNGHVFIHSLPNQPSRASGRLRSVFLPTWGEITYAYTDVKFPYLAGAEHAADVPGVRTRRKYGKDGLLDSRWLLTTSLDLVRQQGTLDQPRELTRFVYFPDGRTDKRDYSVYVSGNAANDQVPPVSFEASEYGLPFTKNGTAAGDPFHLSSETLAADGSRLASVYVDYELESCSGCFDVRPRVQQTRRLTHDPESGEDWIVATVNSDFDGLGHYRTVISADWGSDSLIASAPQRSVFIDYSGKRPLPTEPWVLGFHGKETVFELAESKTVEVCRDPATGLVLRRRILAGTARGAYDLLRVYDYDTRGDLAQTSYYGGDTQPLGTVYADLCSLSLPAQAQYVSFTEHQYGAVSRSGWRAADGSVFLVTGEATIDRNTGLASARHSGDELWTSFTYDALGRLLSTTPPVGHGGAQVNIYTAASSAATGASAEVYTHKDDDAGVVIAESRTFVDDFGRTAKLSSRTVNGWVDIVNDYDAMGRPLSATAPDGSVTRYLSRDAFGRPLSIENPGGPTFLHNFAYGPRSTSETVEIGKRWDEVTDTVQLVSRTTTMVRDRFGRTVERRVEDADGGTRSEKYAYNLAGRVVETTTTDGVNTATSATPDRTDHRGFLVTDGDGAAIFGYDALGHLTLEKTANGTIANLFDRAGRLSERREGSPTGRMWMAYAYAAGNAVGDWRKGKLLRARRRNYGVPHVPDGQVDVVETYTYGGEGGRLSEVTTQVIAGIGAPLTLFTFSTAQTFDAAGRRVGIDYPDCVPDHTNPAMICTPSGRHLAYGYDHGSLTGLTGTSGPLAKPETWIASIAYDLSGLAVETVRGDGTIERRTPHASGGGRLADLTLLDSALVTFYASGLAEYDGQGKLVKLGTQRRVSDNAYSLALPDVPPVTGTPPLLPPKDQFDLLGNSPGRHYQIPSRNASMSQDGIEQVWEIHVYGPRGRLWTRKFNDFDVWNYGLSQDTWYLADPSGRKVRTLSTLTRYQNRWVTYNTAVLTKVQSSGEGEDSIFVGPDLLATAGAASPLRTYYHRDIEGRTLATSDAQGQVETNRAPLQ